MAILPIAIYPEPILSKVAAPVDHVTRDIRILLDDMTETMYVAPGVGLAGPQVHEGKRVIVIDAGETPPLNMDDAKRTEPRGSRLYQLVNPRITHAEGELTWEEGCLSLPDFHLMRTRAARVTVEALDRQGAPITIVGEGLLAIVLQHEIDHLDGKLLVDALSRLKRKMYIDRLKKMRLAEK